MLEKRGNIMWKTTGYIINLDKFSEDKFQQATCRSSELTNKNITKKQFKQIMKIIKET